MWAVKTLWLITELSHQAAVGTAWHDCMASLHVQVHAVCLEPRMQSSGEMQHRQSLLEQFAFILCLVLNS